MTTQQKITAIQAIVTNHHDNVAAMSSTNVGQGLEALVIEAMNTALKDDLAVIFAANSSRPTQVTSGCVLPHKMFGESAKRDTRGVYAPQTGEPEVAGQK